MSFILVIDNEVPMANLLESLLTHLGYQAHSVSDGREGIRLLDEDHKYEAVLTDIDMPGISGYDIAQHVRNSEKPHLPLIATTGLSESLLENNQFDLVLQKPFSLDQLKSALQSLLPTPK